MTAKTALTTARDMPLPHYAEDALKYARHPQERTRAFHMFYGAPIHAERPDMRFSHMDDQRAAFRAAFIISEALELLEQGFGLRVGLNITTPGGTYTADGSGDSRLTQMLFAAIKASGRRDLVGVVDGLGDLNVVVNGFALELGVDMHVVDQEVCASNFTKMGLDGKPIIGDGTTGPVGKVLKGPNFVPPQLAAVLGLDPAA